MIDEARLLFDTMPERDVFSWSSMISGYAQTEQSQSALELFQRMVLKGIQPNEITMVSILSAIASLGTLKEGIWAHDYIRENSIPLGRQVQKLREAAVERGDEDEDDDEDEVVFDQITFLVETQLDDTSSF